MSVRDWELTDVLNDSTEAVERLTVSVNQHLGEIKQSTLLELLGQIGELRGRLDRLAYAVKSAAPLGELDKQIAQNEAAERLGAERARVEAARSTNE